MRALLALLTLVFAFSPKSAVAQSGPRRGNAARCIWMLDNCDADFKQPPFEDSLTVLDESGRVIRKMTVFNICQTVGGNRAVNLSPDGLLAVVTENVRDRLTCYRFPGEKKWSLSAEVLAVDISRNGKAYVLTAKGTIYGDQLLALDLEDGSKSAQVAVGGFDLAVDDRHEKIWVVGADIQRLSRNNMAVDFQLDPIEWCAVSVDFAADGSAWVAEREHSQVVGSRKRLLHISSTGKIVESIDLEQEPVCLAIDRINRLLWVASGTKLLVYDSGGRLVTAIESGPCWTVRVRQSDQTAWAATLTGEVLQFDHVGRKLSRIDGFSRDQKYIAVPSGEQRLTTEDP